MSHFIKAPHPALKPYIQDFWFLHFKIPHAKSLPPLAATPVPQQALYFYPRQKGIARTLDGRKIVPPTAMIGGQGTERINYYLPEDYLMFKIVFQPSGFYRLFGTPMTLFVDNNEDAVSVLGNDMKAVQERIEAVDDFETMVKIAETYLFQKIKQAKYSELPIDKVLSQLNWQNQSLDKIAHESCLSSRQFERNFLNRLGVSPKFYGRLYRFNETMKLKEKKPTLSWMNIAYDSGYFDHNHLLRDFKQFTGAMPSNFDLDQALFY